MVVVGGGAAALSLLEGLLLDPLYHFTSITVLAPQGLRPEVSHAWTHPQAKLEFPASVSPLPLLRCGSTPFPIPSSL